MIPMRDVGNYSDGEKAGFSGMGGGLRGMDEGTPGGEDDVQVSSLGHWVSGDALGHPGKGVAFLCRGPGA